MKTSKTSSDHQPVSQTKLAMRVASPQPQGHKLISPRIRFWGKPIVHIRHHSKSPKMSSQSSPNKQKSTTIEIENINPFFSEEAQTAIARSSQHIDLLADIRPFYTLFSFCLLTYDYRDLPHFDMWRTRAAALPFQELLTTIKHIFADARIKQNFITGGLKVFISPQADASLFRATLQEKISDAVTLGEKLQALDNDSIKAAHQSFETFIKTTRISVTPPTPKFWSGRVVETFSGFGSNQLNVTQAVSYVVAAEETELSNNIATTKI